MRTDIHSRGDRKKSDTPPSVEKGRIPGEKRRTGSVAKKKKKLGVFLRSKKDLKGVDGTGVPPGTNGERHNGRANMMIKPKGEKNRTGRRTPQSP